MAQPVKVPFLARSGYRQRRLRDVAGMVPVFGILLLQLPLLWPRGEGESLLSHAMIYLFALWVILIAVAVYLARAIREDADVQPESQDET